MVLILRFFASTNFDTCGQVYIASKNIEARDIIFTVTLYNDNKSIHTKFDPYGANHGDDFKASVKLGFRRNFGSYTLEDHEFQ